MNKYNFLDIISEKGIVITDKETQKNIYINKIEIPMIQRDYAQGREKEKEVRTRFLTSIFNKLKNDEELELDFVYGSLRENADNSDKFDFIPLDGQQRLTTLFLLYWYIGYRELDDTNELEKNLEKFSYATRVSARRFCEELSKTKISYEKQPSEEILDWPWFYKSYLKDPTIKSMLTMLDEIHTYYSKSNKRLYDNLQNIKFYLLPLSGFNLTEELYIKMNARGKQLTDFENFKADFINWMIESEKFSDKVTYNRRTMPEYFSIAEKIDTKWTQLFWGIVNTTNNDKKVVDPLLMSFLNRFLTNEYVITSKTDNKALKEDDKFLFFYDEKRYQSFEFYKEQFDNKDLVKKIEKILDIFSKDWDNITDYIKPSWGEDINLFDKSITQPLRVIFYAVTVFIEKFGFQEENFRKWMRVVWNIVENTDINDIPTMASAIKLINSFSSRADNVYNYLANLDINNISSSKEAVKEEIKKAEFIEKDPSWEKVFIDAESHKFFKGSIDFIITNDITYDKFNHRKDIAFKVFNSSGVNDKYREEHIFLRALISRFTEYENIIDKSFTDKYEKENYLKRMLASDDTVKKTTRELFDSEDESKLKEKLENWIKDDSQMVHWNNDDDWRIKKAHESLYKTPELQKWMQYVRAYRMNWRDDHIYVSRHGSWYDWVMIDSYRNEIISKLLEKGFTTDRHCKINNEQDIIPYFWGNDTILVEKKEDENTIVYSFEKDGKLKILINDDEILEESYMDVNSYEKIENWIEQIEKKLYKSTNH